MADAAKRFVCMALLAAIVLPSIAAADTLVMTDGNTFQGKIVKETDKEVVLQVQYGTMSFDRQHVRSVAKGPWTPAKAPAARPEDDAWRKRMDHALKDELPLLKHAQEAEWAGHLAGAIEILKHARGVAKAMNPTEVTAIDEKIERLEAEARVQVEVKIEKVFIVAPVRETKREGVVGQQHAETKAQAEANARRTVAEALPPMFAEALRRQGFIPVLDPGAAVPRMRRLTVTYAETGGIPMYSERTGNPFGYKLDVAVQITLTRVDGTTAWTTSLQAVTPTLIREGATRAATLAVLDQKIDRLRIGERPHQVGRIRLDEHRNRERRDRTDPLKNDG